MIKLDLTNNINSIVMHKIILLTFILLIAACCNKKAIINDVSVENAWIREAPPNASMLAGYATIKNNTEQDRTLRFAKSEHFKMVEVHKTIVKDGVAKMRRQDNLAIPAGTSLELKPGSYHLMLMNPKSALEENDEIVITLGLQHGESIEEVNVVMPVQKSK